jgi:hypothetical protein
MAIHGAGDDHTRDRASVFGTALVAVAATALVIGLGLSLGVLGSRPAGAAAAAWSMPIAFLAPFVAGLATAGRRRHLVFVPWAVAVLTTGLLVANLAADLGAPPTARKVAIAGWWSFVYLLLGMIGTSVGGQLGRRA